MRRAARYAAALATAGALGLGCAANPGGTTLALEVEPLAGDVEIATSSREVEVRVVSHFIFWVPTRASSPSLSEAIAEALERGNGDLLLDAHVTRIAWYVPLLYGEFGWEVRGDVVRVRKRLPPPPVEAP